MMVFAHYGLKLLRPSDNCWICIEIKLQEVGLWPLMGIVGTGFHLGAEKERNTNAHYTFSDQYFLSLLEIIFLPFHFVLVYPLKCG